LSRALIAGEPGLCPGLQRPSARRPPVISPADGVKIHALDSKVINVKPASAKGWNKYDRIRLRPGTYVLTVIPQDIETIKSFTRLTVQVEAGQRYRVRSQFYPGPNGRPGYYKFWMEDEATREVVSDIAESRNPFQPPQ
jgi:hypothetical protein